jgi:hypothetical protein
MVKDSNKNKIFKNNSRYIEHNYVFSEQDFEII